MVRTINVTRSRSISLIVPAATVDQARQFLFGRWLPLSRSPTHRDRRSVGGISKVHQADRGLALQSQFYPSGWNASFHLLDLNCTTELRGALAGARAASISAIRR